MKPGSLRTPRTPYASWMNEERNQDHAESILQGALMDQLRLRRVVVSQTDIGPDALILACRAEIAAAMVYGDFGAATELTDLLHSMVQRMADAP